MHSFQPVVLRDVAPSAWPEVCGSCSHAFEHELGAVYATIHGPFGLAQAFVHELAHSKLFALGFGKESSGRLVINPTAERYPSAIRTDEPRPMSALLHAQYAFLHVVALDLAMLAAEADGAARAHLVELLDRNVSRMEQGRRTIREHGRFDRYGAAFLSRFTPWSESLLDQGRTVLARLRPTG